MQTRASRQTLSPVRWAGWLVALCCCLVTLPVQADNDFRVTPAIRKAYASVMALRLDDARKELHAIHSGDPSNLLTVFIEDYIDFFTLFIGEQETEYERLKDNRSARLDALKEGDPDSPYLLYTQAEIHLHWALIRFKFDDNLAAARDINRAFRLLKRNERRFPDFAPNLKSLGMLRAGVGTIPDKYLWAVKLLSSLEGTIEGGLSDMRRALRLGAQDEIFNQREAHIFYTMALLHFGNDPDGAWNHLQSAGLNPAENTVDCFIMGNIAMKTRRIDAAINILTRRPRDPGIHSFDYLDFTLGLCKLYRLDADADVPLRKYVSEFEGINYIKEAYQKLAWHALINGDAQGYKNYMRACLVRGAAVTDEDQHALKEAESGIVPHAGLLRARLLFDGGANDRALRAIRSINKRDLNTEQALEYTYRLGRIHHALSQHRQALEAYDQTIARGADSPRYFACNAALQAGLIHESEKSWSEARDYFETCLDLKPSEYQSSLHQKAKSGLNRVKGLE